MSFADLIQLPQYTRKEQKREKIYKSFWMTSEENFQIIKKIETETAKKEADKKEKENIKKEAVMKGRKEKAAIKKKTKETCYNKNKNPTLNCKTVSLETFSSILPDRLRWTTMCRVTVKETPVALVQLKMVFPVIKWH